MNFGFFHCNFIESGLDVGVIALFRVTQMIDVGSRIVLNTMKCIHTLWHPSTSLDGCQPSELYARTGGAISQPFEVVNEVCVRPLLIDMPFFSFLVLC